MEEKILVRTITFDVNGTLLNDTHIFLATINKMLRSLGLEVLPHDKLRREFGQPWTKIFRDKGIKEEKWSDKALYNLYNVIYSSFPAPDLSEGAAETLKVLKERGFELGILSVQQYQMTKRALQKSSGFLGLFTAALHGVPDKAKALQVMDHNCGPVVYVGDQVHDIVCANNVRVRAIAFTNGLHPEDMFQEARCFAKIKSFRELLELPFERI
ncbi:MAG: HAD hydrolase-like protein [Patescibacteria group bacterium]|nr:HAD hydrolase-like protein [Patescibacteria group bacterium]